MKRPSEDLKKSIHNHWGGETRIYVAYWALMAFRGHYTLDFFDTVWLAVTLGFMVGRIEISSKNSPKDGPDLFIEEFTDFLNNENFEGNVRMFWGGEGQIFVAHHETLVTFMEHRKLSSENILWIAMGFGLEAGQTEKDGPDLSIKGFIDFLNQ